MLRILVLVLAIVSATSLPQGAPKSAGIATPRMIGEDRPVFLGRMTITATPLPRH